MAFMAYLTNEAITVELAGYTITNLPYAENGVPYVAETYSVTDDYLEENRDLLKAFLTAEIKGWTDVFKEPTDGTVDVITKYYDKAASENDSGLEKQFGALDPKKTGIALEAEKKLISTTGHRGERAVHHHRRTQGADGRIPRRRRLEGLRRRSVRHFDHR